MKTVATRLRVHERSVTRWRKSWHEGGTQALLSKGPVSKEKLSAQQWERLETGLRRGPPAWGIRREPVLDPGTGQDADRPAVPHRLHHRGSGQAAASPRLVGPGPGAAGLGAG
ncbi:helix-turn-helix domain-containing protein [Nonomuraea angiospora]|uniref:helix-turn-helix domain-containing protein n=1 Tax=Nonomuraea angiospora TaxID=46172 RepID=UPI003B594F6F